MLCATAISSSFAAQPPLKRSFSVVKNLFSNFSINGNTLEIKNDKFYEFPEDSKLQFSKIIVHPTCSKVNLKNVSFKGELVLPKNTWLGQMSIELPTTGNSVMLQKVTHPDSLGVNELIKLILSNNTSNECKEDLLKSLKKTFEYKRYMLNGGNNVAEIIEGLGYEPTDDCLQKLFQCFLDGIKDFNRNSRFPLRQILNQLTDTVIPDDIKPQFIEEVKMSLRNFVLSDKDLSDVRSFIEKQGYHWDDVTRGIEIKQKSLR